MIDMTQGEVSGKEADGRKDMSKRSCIVLIQTLYEKRNKAEERSVASHNSSNIYYPVAARWLLYIQYRKNPDISS